MAGKFIDVEKNAFLTENIQYYTSNKVNQYSKFLDKNPIFITYLAINDILTRHDIGTGGIESDIGPSSPVRFNQINGLPAFNIPELKPEVIFDERGYDVELDLNDITLPPNTIKPKVGDYIIIKIPNSAQCVFRVNEFRYNTIQSNDFYLFNADLKYAGVEDQLERFKPQIVEVYETIFDNIGTQEKCFIRQTNLESAKSLASLLREILDLYRINFFDQTSGCFVSKNNTENVDPSCDDAWYYDKYVNRFIMDSEIYFDPSGVDTVAPTQEDIAEQSDKWYRRSLYYAVLKRNTLLLGRFPYAYQVGIQKHLSVFVIYEIPCRTAYLHITDYKLYEGHSDGLDSTYLYEYFPHALIHKILDNDPYEVKIEERYNPHTCWKGNHGEEEIEDGKNQSGSISETEQFDAFDQDTNEEKSNTCKDVPLQCGDIQRTQNHGTPEIEPPITETRPAELYQFTYLDELILSYLLGKTITVTREKILPIAIQCNNYIYKMMPMVVYILIDYYHSYFREEKITDL